MKEKTHNMTSMILKYSHSRATRTKVPKIGKKS